MISRLSGSITPISGVDDATESKRIRERARSVIEKVAENKSTSIVSSIVCDFVDKGPENIGLLRHIKNTGDCTGFHMIIPTWAWQQPELPSLYELGLSRFK